MRLALNGASLSAWMLSDMVDFAKEAGISSVLLPLSLLGSDAAALPQQGRKKIRDTAQKSGITIAGLSELLGRRTHKLVGGPVTRAATVAQLRETIRLCYDLGARMASVELPDWEQLRGRLRLPQAQALAAEVLRECMPLAESRHVTLCLHGPGATEAFIKSVEHPNLRLGCDAKTFNTSATTPQQVRLILADIGDDACALADTLRLAHFDGTLAITPSKEADSQQETSQWLKTFRERLHPAKS